MKLLGLILLLTIITGCNHIELQSLWKDFEIEIDGKDNDWDDAKIYMKDKNLVIGIANDEEFLYLCFYPTTNIGVKQVLRQGISFWFNTDGKKNRNNGFSYPLAMIESGLDGDEDNSEVANIHPERRRNEDRSVNLERLVYNLKLNNNYIEISSEISDQKFPITAVYGMDICFDAENNVFAYEAKIPLNDPKASFSLGIDPGAEIMIGLQSKALHGNVLQGKSKDMIEEFENGASGDVSGNSSGNMEESSSSGRGSRKEGRARSGGLKPSSDVSLWAKVKLAEVPKE